ncbi:hypothetical protein EG68_06743 [Paragonimus skrjabini miyazakii]|uniref:Uncharacterized protein n=1 Tax=Paragonimus skrjabini miyazakii TaxID=59628 RepID=A0A8S9YWC5_9TREM|nr:hypothetical protein EG68_06743 [Paragonimus skrjabini miyazakii]
MHIPLEVCRHCNLDLDRLAVREGKTSKHFHIFRTDPILGNPNFNQIRTSGRNNMPTCGRCPTSLATKPRQKLSNFTFGSSYPPN